MSTTPADNGERIPQQVRDLAVYIHWPFCKSKCPYCDFNSHVRDSVDQARWRDALLAELDYMHAQAQHRRVTSIFFGGGTPSLMPPETTAALIDRVHALWPVAQDIEITLEANPTSVEAQRFRDFRAAGVNRVSLGVQSLIDKELQFLGRGHSAQEALRAIDLARSTFDRYSFDLIYARPQQNVALWEAELDEALRHIGGHMSLYQLTIEENTAFHHTYQKGGFTLPDEAESEALYRATEGVMAAHGLIAYEVSNYARPGEESRHNLAYWQGMDYIGVGPGAHGRLTLQKDIARSADRVSLEPSPMRAPVGAQRGQHRVATQTIKSPERWLESVERQGNGVEVWESIEQVREAEERLMMGLRLSQGIGYREFEQQAAFALEPHLDLGRRDFYIAQGLLENDPTRLQTTLKGRLVLSKLTAELLA